MNVRQSMSTGGVGGSLSLMPCNMPNPDVKKKEILSAPQLAVLNRCARNAQPSTAKIQNTSRALIRRGLLRRETYFSDRAYLVITDAGRAAWSAAMRALARKGDLATMMRVQEAGR